MDQWIIKFNNYWFTFSKNIGLSIEKSNDLYEILFHAYTEPHRCYHNVQHIVECLDLYRQVKALLYQPAWVELAIWFHDAVYDPQSNENEMRSALLMQNLCECFLDKDAIATIFLWIVATMHHLPSDQNDLKYLLDIDLAILGTLPERFSEYERQIRQEYIWVPSAIYAIKRSEVLSKFKHQTPIYQTKFFQKMLESRAYLNLSQNCFLSKIDF